MIVFRVDFASCFASAWWHYRAQLAHVGSEVQLRQDDLPQVLRPTPPSRRQLPQAQVWPHLQPAPQEEAEVDG